MRRLFAVLIALCIAVPCFGQDDHFVVPYKKKAAAGGAPEWSLVGSTSAALVVEAGTQEINLPNSPVEGDLVIVAVAADGRGDGTVATAGYTSPENPTTDVPGVQSAYKVLGATPDSIVTVNKSAVYKKVVIVQVWRGADAATPLDQSYSASPATGDSVNPDSPSITTQNANALVVSVMYLDDDETTVSAWPTGYTNGVEAHTNGAGGNLGATVAFSSKIVASPGAEDPGAYTVGSQDVWRAASISFKLGS